MNLVTTLVEWKTHEEKQLDQGGVVSYKLKTTCMSSLCVGQLKILVIRSSQILLQDVLLLTHDGNVNLTPSYTKYITKISQLVFEYPYTKLISNCMYKMFVGNKQSIHLCVAKPTSICIYERVSHYYRQANELSEI